MTSKIIVADAGPLIAFGSIQKLSLISQSVGRIMVPSVVADECLVDKSKSGAAEIDRAIKEGEIEVYQIENLDSYPGLFQLLGEGEASAIVLAHQKKLPILIDDKLGRRAAENFHLAVIGTVGILLLAKKKKLIKTIKPIIAKLHESGYYFSEKLKKDILKIANEAL